MMTIKMMVMVIAAAVVSAEQVLDDMNLSPDYEHAPFYHGVASGDPLEDRVLIWTRVEPLENNPVINSIEWRLWEKDNEMQSFETPLQSGTAGVDPLMDYTVTVDVIGLTAGTKYHYQFLEPASGSVSMLGTTQTIIVDASSMSSISIAMMSCTSLWSGYFNFYRHLANNPDVDVVLHVGDYIYPEIDGDEPYRVPYGLCPNKSQFAGGAQVGGRPEDNDDPYLQQLVASLDCNVTDHLAEYRFTHNLYHLDPDFRAAKANHPFIIQFDNHDLNGPSNDPTEGSRKASIEWVPQRRTYQADGTIVTTLRNYTWGGNLVDIIALDTYTYEQNKSENGLLGDGQHEWLDGVLQHSAAMGTKWRMIGTAKSFMPFTLNILLPFQDELVYANANSLTWEGNPDSMQRLFDQLEATGTSNNNLWVSGDMHWCYASDVFRYDPNTLDLLDYRPISQKYTRYGGEVLACSGSRGNVNEGVGQIVPILHPDNVILSTTVNNILDVLVQEGNAHYRYWNGRDHGYGVATFTPNQMTATIYFFPLLKITNRFESHTMTMRDGQNRWDFF